MEYSIAKALPILEKTPALLTFWLQGLDDEWISNNEGEEAWSPYDVVGHLIHGERTDWMARIKKTLSDHDKEYVPFDRFAQFEESKGKTLDQLLAEFTIARKQNLEELTSLNISEQDLFKTAIHPSFGIVTLRQLLSTWVAHDLSHIGQIARVMAKQYKEEVGPWSEYLTIMHR
ncbi:DinB family protein [Polluticoccus soli]|uniref:DinB family protein n=1 Tax=Polluticoccus soli TaxID=3034150 RepID=UPI0023E1A569|nr:DinB family protein [Flavipsychrobacter sp. JY13-12]